MPERSTEIVVNESKRPGRQIVALISAVGLLNVITWVLLFALAWRLDHALMEIGALAYFLGVRHGFDADHIAAIDNVTRKLKQDNKPCSATGFFFALGHSTIVILLTLAVVIGVSLHASSFRSAPSWGGMLGAIVSATFLTLIGLVNLVAFMQLWRAFRRRAGSSQDRAEIDRQIAALLERRGVAARLFRFIYRRIDASWKMYFVGFLFGLGFDTATEIALLGISAGVAAHGHFPFWSVMVLPALFTAGMALVDTLDGAVMERVYEWAADDHERKMLFNLGVTGVTVLIAILIGGIEWLQVVSLRFGLDGPFWKWVDGMDFARLGISAIVLLLAVWLAAWWTYRRRIRVAST